MEGDQARFAVFVVTPAPDYALAALPCVYGWRKLGWDVAVIVDPAGRSDLAAKIAAVLAEAGADAEIATEAQLRQVEICKPRRWLALRYLLMREISQAMPHALVALTDSDMIRVTPLEPPENWHGNLLCWNSNVYRGSEWDPRWPSCHVGGDWEAWKQLPDMTVAYAEGGRCGTIWSDEVAMRTFFLAHPELRRIDIPRVLDPPEAVRRIDRHLWAAERPLAEQIDAHIQRGCHFDELWNDGIRQKLEAWLTPDEFANVEKFRTWCLEHR